VATVDFAGHVRFVGYSQNPERYYAATDVFPWRATAAGKLVEVFLRLFRRFVPPAPAAILGVGSGSASLSGRACAGRGGAA
jgi:hypothetical protein